MEKKFGGQKSRIETAANESFRGRLPGMLREMRKCAVLKTVSHSMTGNDLLSNASNHLRDVDSRALNT